MMTIANTQQNDYWNEEAGPKWVRNQAALDDQINLLGQLAQDALNPQAGEKILDIGCGCGQTSLQLAEKVGPTGHVVGADISGTMLAHAKSRIKSDNIEFTQADAQVYAFPNAYFDAGLFPVWRHVFEDPIAAFSNIRTALKPGGRLTFACWQPMADNVWMSLPLRAAAQHLEMPPPPDPHAPGPFAFADKQRVQNILEGAGFQEVQTEPSNGLLQPGGNLNFDQTVEFIMEIGPITALLKNASDEQRQAVISAVREVMQPYNSDEGVRMAYAIWIVTAINPD